MSEYTRLSSPFGAAVRPLCFDTRFAAGFFARAGFAALPPDVFLRFLAAIALISPCPRAKQASQSSDAAAFADLTKRRFSIAMPARREFVSELLGTAFLLCAVVGSGIMGERLAAGNDALALLANSLATAAALFVLILAAAPWSGAHFNPIVSLVAVARSELSPAQLPRYLTAQVLGAYLGVAVANVMFELPAFTASQHARTGIGQWLGEFVASCGLLLTIRLVGVARPALVAPAVACFIGAAYWFTASTSFANPAVTLARSATDTFAGIRPADVPGFVFVQALAAVAVIVGERALCGKPLRRS